MTYVYEVLWLYHSLLLYLYRAEGCGVLSESYVIPLSAMGLTPRLRPNNIFIIA